MRLELSYEELSELYQLELQQSGRKLRAVAFDTRRITQGYKTLFFALKGEFRDGHDFVREAYNKGVRAFVTNHRIELPEDAVQFIVPDTLQALQQLAQKHRSKFNIPVVSITGSAGKTIVKEWLSDLLSTTFQVVKSPKSYNSQIGVALSLLELNKDAEIAIIEAGISKPDEMIQLREMIQPTIGIFTSFGSAHAENFPSTEKHLSEKTSLFESVEKAFIHQSIPLKRIEHNYEVVNNSDYTQLLQGSPFQDEISRNNAAMAISVARYLGLSDETIARSINELQPVALRLETFDGQNNNIIINDPYNMDLDAFRSSLEHQLSIAQGKERVVLIGWDKQYNNRQEIDALIEEFAPITCHYVDNPSDWNTSQSNSILLIKGHRSMHMERLALRLRAKKHATYLEIDLSAIKHNVNYFRQRIGEESQLLTMVKAGSYGSGIEKIGLYLERIGADYLGVAYADEGVELRNSGVQLPILVMNTEEAGFEDCIAYDLEPCIYSSDQLEVFIKQLIYAGRQLFPIHIKIETGMNRLGFQPQQLPKLINQLKSQPEVHVKSAYTHLAISDQPNSSFTEEQIDRFDIAVAELKQHLPYHFDKHVLNSEGILNFPHHSKDMVRLGIGMYGYSSNPEHQANLLPAIKWYSSVSQVREIPAKQTVGYGRHGVVDYATKIAVIPVGYADGFRRSLSQGKGQVFINGHQCPVIGNVCMDMIMVEIKDLEIDAGDRVEIIGDHQSLSTLAEAMNTIPYEVLTGISKRVHRVYTED